MSKQNYFLLMVIASTNNPPASIKASHLCPVFMFSYESPPAFRQILSVEI